MRNGIALAALMVASVWGADAWAAEYCSPGIDSSEADFISNGGSAAPAEVYEITIKKVLFCTTEDCSGSSNVTLFEGSKTLDIASLSSGAFEQLVPPTTIIPAGTYKAIGFVLANRFNIKGMVEVSGQYCATPTSVSPGTMTICVEGDPAVTSPPNSSGTITVSLPRVDVLEDPKFTVVIGDGGIVGNDEFGIAFKFEGEVVVQETLQVGDVSETIGLFFNVDSGVGAQIYKDKNNATNTLCRVGLGAVKVTFKIGDQALVNDEEIEISLTQQPPY